MTGWSDEENRFEISINDFTPVKIDNEEMANNAFEESCNNKLDCHNYFYDKLGFQTGTYFEGEKKMYLKKSKN
jgi:hypothetical protein